MYDAKTVRRRRAVLGLLVVLSLILLTASFGDGGGPLRSVQRGVLEVVSPIQEGASRALKPFRDLFGWIDDTIDAKGEVEDLRTERDRYRAEAIKAKNALQENQRFRDLLGLDRRAELDRYEPVTARVIGRSSIVLASTINIDKGSTSGIEEDQAVVTGAGLVGKVTTVTPHAAKVTLISDHTIGVSARILESGVTGLVETAVGNPRSLILKYTRRTDVVEEDQIVVTAGTRSSDPKLESLFPPGIPIGEVTRVEEPGSDAQEVFLRPYVDVGRIDFVQVLTERANGNRPIQ